MKSSQFSHLQTQPLKRIGSRNTGLSRLTKSENFQNKVGSQSTVGLHSYRRGGDQSNMNATHEYQTVSPSVVLRKSRQGKISSGVGNINQNQQLSLIGSVHKPSSFRSSIHTNNPRAPSEKTFDSTMSHELENAIIPKMQMHSAQAKSPQTVKNMESKNMKPGLLFPHSIHQIDKKRLSFASKKESGHRQKMAMQPPYRERKLQNMSYLHKGNSTLSLKKVSLTNTSTDQKRVIQSAFTTSATKTHKNQPQQHKTQLNLSAKLAASGNKHNRQSNYLKSQPVLTKALQDTRQCQYPQQQPLSERKVNYTKEKFFNSSQQYRRGSLQNPHNHHNFQANLIPSFPYHQSPINNQASRSALHCQTQTHLLESELGIVDEEEAMPLRPMTQQRTVTSNHDQYQHAGNPTTTFFGLSEDDVDGQQSEVRSHSIKDEMNDTGIVELVYGIRQEGGIHGSSNLNNALHQQNYLTPLTQKLAPYSFYGSSSPNSTSRPSKAGPHQHQMILTSSLAKTSQNQNDLGHSQRTLKASKPPQLQSNNRQQYSSEVLFSLEQRFQKERESDRAKIASLEAYVEQIHAEFTKNKQLMQMLISKVEADEKLIEQVNELKLSLKTTTPINNSTVAETSTKIETGVQTEDLAGLILQTAATQEAAANNSAGSDHRVVFQSATAAFSIGQSSMTGTDGGALNSSQLAT